MIELLSNSLSNFIQNNAEGFYKTKEMEEIVSFGSKILISTLFNVSIILGLGVVNHKLCESIFFIISFCVIKGFAGGYHAKTLTKCSVFTIGIFSSVLLLDNLLEQHFAYLIIVDLVLTVFLIKYEPLGTKENPYPFKIRKARKCKALVMIYFLIGLFILFSEIKAYYGLSGILWAEIMFVIGRILNDEKNNKKNKNKCK